MRRFIAIALFVAGGFAAEWVHPVDCQLMCAGPVRAKRRDDRRGGVGD